MLIKRAKSLLEKELNVSGLALHQWNTTDDEISSKRSFSNRLLALFINIFQFILLGPYAPLGAKRPK